MYKKICGALIHGVKYEKTVFFFSFALTTTNLSYGAYGLDERAFVFVV